MINIPQICTDFKLKLLTGALNLEESSVYCSMIIDPSAEINLANVRYTTELVNFKLEHPNKLTSTPFKFIGPFNSDKCFGIVVHTADTIITHIPVTSIELTSLSELTISWESSNNIIAEL